MCFIIFGLGASANDEGLRQLAKSLKRSPGEVLCEICVIFVMLSCKKNNMMIMM